MSEFSSHELISAYVDNQLSAREREEVDALLENSAEARAELESYRRLSSVLKNLPAENAADDLARRVLVQAERQSLLGTSSSQTDRLSNSRSNRRWAISMAAFLTTATLLFLALTQIQPPADQADLVATNESATPSSGTVSDMKLLSALEEEEEMMAELSNEDLGRSDAGLPELMDAPDRISVEFGENGLLKLINPQNLKTAEIGDTVEGWRFDDDRVVVVQLTVVDRDQVLNSMQVLLSDLSIPYESGDQKSRTDENGDFYAVYVEADSEKMTAALRELQEDMNIGEMLVSANVDSDDLNPYFKEQGYAYVNSGELNNTKTPARFSVPAEPSATPAKLAANKPQKSASTEKKDPPASDALSMEIADTKNDDSLPPPPPLPEEARQLSIAKSSLPESSRQLQLRLPEAVANQMIYQQRTHKNESLGQPSIFNRFATERAEELKDLRRLKESSKPADIAKAPIVAGRKPDGIATAFERKMALKESSIPVQVLFVLTPEQRPAAPASKVPNRK